MSSSAVEPWVRRLRTFLGETSEPTLPATFLRYDRVEQVGEGGSAFVYRAIDTELDRPVAIKMLREPFRGGTLTRQRFRREGHVLAQLRHENIVKLYDMGDWEGRPYLVLELIEGGRTLASVLAGGELDLRGRLDLVRQAACGLAGAHALGVVHRDLKPGNILVTPQGSVKVADFGLAHLLEADSHLTRTGALLGTPLYMAPEQVFGSGQPVTPQTDVHALGVILYELLTGLPPFAHLRNEDLLLAIRDHEPPAPRSVDPGIPESLERVCMKALQKEPHYRYASAGDVAEEIQRYLDGEAVRATPPERFDPSDGRFVENPESLSQESC